MREKWKEKPVIIYVMRHGNKDGDRLTAEGFGQVRRSAQENLAGIKFDMVYCSMKNRALQTVETAIKELGINGIDIQQRLGFDYEGAPSLERADDWQKAVTELANGGKIMISHWKSVAPEFASFVANRFREELKKVVCELVAAHPDQEAFQVLIGSHTPVAELVKFEGDFPTLGEADIVRYTLNYIEAHNDISGVEFISKEYIPAPAE